MEGKIINVSVKNLNVHTDIRKSFRGELVGKWLCCVRNYRLSSLSKKQRMVDVCCDQVNVDTVGKLPLLIAAVTDEGGIQSIDTLRWKALTITSMDNFIIRILENQEGKNTIIKLNNDSFVVLVFKRDAT